MCRTTGGAPCSPVSRHHTRYRTSRRGSSSQRGRTVTSTEESLEDPPTGQSDGQDTFKPEPPSAAGPKRPPPTGSPCGHAAPADGKSQPRHVERGGMMPFWLVKVVMLIAGWCPDERASAQCATTVRPQPTCCRRRSSGSTWPPGSVLLSMADAPAPSSPAGLPTQRSWSSPDRSAPPRSPTPGASAQVRVCSWP